MSVFTGSAKTVVGLVRRFWDFSALILNKLVFDELHLLIFAHDTGCWARSPMRLFRHRAELMEGTRRKEVRGFRLQKNL
jgi:hypothetical protein